MLAEALAAVLAIVIFILGGLDAVFLATACGVAVFIAAFNAQAALVAVFHVGIICGAGFPVAALLAVRAAVNAMLCITMLGLLRGRKAGIADDAVQGVAGIVCAVIAEAAIGADVSPRTALAAVALAAQLVFLAQVAVVTFGAVSLRVALYAVYAPGTFFAPLLECKEATAAVPAVGFKPAVGAGAWAADVAAAIAKIVVIDIAVIDGAAQCTHVLFTVGKSRCWHKSDHHDKAKQQT